MNNQLLLASGPLPPLPLLLPATCPPRAAPRKRLRAVGREMGHVPPSLLDTVSCADALAFLRALPDGCVNCVVTRPPYFGLRDYGVSGQMGLESSPAAFIAAMVCLFREVRRVLRNDGTLWVNIGDSYSTRLGGDGWGGYEWKTGGNVAPADGTLSDVKRSRDDIGLPTKSLLMIPARLAIAMQDDGWILRSDIIWHKPNPMPESVTDRPTKSHEYVYLFAKSGRYWYDADAIRERQETADRSLFYDIDAPKGKTPTWGIDGSQSLRDKGRAPRLLNPVGRNVRSVWTIATEPTPFAHFATFPTALVERCIMAGCPADGVVFDPFMGSGTTALVARRLNRHYIGCDLNPDYVKLANDRLSQSDPFQPTILPNGAAQLSLFAADTEGGAT